MKNKNLTEASKPEIISSLMQTFPYRRQWIEDSIPAVFEVFKKNTRLLDYNGEIVGRSV